MDHFSHLWLFFLMVLGIIVLPGMDMAFVMASSLTGGRRSGLFAVSGIVAGGMCHVVAGVLGLGLLLQLVPGMVHVMLLAGSAYIAWIGWSLIQSTSVFGDLPAVHSHSPWRTFRQAALTCLLNPKAYLFMLAIFPQFLRLEYRLAVAAGDRAGADHCDHANRGVWLAGAGGRRHAPVAGQPPRGQRCPGAGSWRHADAERGLHRLAGLAPAVTVPMVFRRAGPGAPSVPRYCLRGR
ncbi:LysE family translocator [Polaromonas sp. P1(28)-8]|nr:LysE family translocator [Polaromonas sp. P1(28)-8]